jgi:hypothetical protein
MNEGGQVLMLASAAAVVAAVAALVTVLGKAPAVFAMSLGFLSAVDARHVALTIVTVCAAMVTLAAASKLRPVRWCWRTWIADPITTWVRHVLREHTKEVVEPLIAPIIDRLDALEATKPD